jgi:hypothetical protein
MIAISTPQALACQFGEPRPVPPKAYWQSAPLVASGEVAVEVSPVRYAELTDRRNIDVVIIGCGPMYRVYRVVRVLAGDATEQQEILVPIGYDFGSDNPILVGRLMAQREVGFAEHLSLDVNGSSLVLQPRLPPQ